jgi:hypothetical protein
MKTQHSSNIQHDAGISSGHSAISHKTLLPSSLSSASSHHTADFICLHPSTSHPMLDFIFQPLAS